jgi:hypothetical protein
MVEQLPLQTTSVSKYPVMVSSRTFGYGAKADQLNQLFHHFSLSPIILPLEKMDRDCGATLSEAWRSH